MRVDRIEHHDRMRAAPRISHARDANELIIMIIGHTCDDKSINLVSAYGSWEFECCGCGAMWTAPTSANPGEYERLMRTPSMRFWLRLVDGCGSMSDYGDMLDGVSDMLLRLIRRR